MTWRRLLHGIDGALNSTLTFAGDLADRRADLDQRSSAADADGEQRNGDLPVVPGRRNF